MSALLLALALFLQDAPAPDAAPPAPPFPNGAPTDDYGLVGWCYGALGGYLDLHDQVMPEVTRIESTYRSPYSTLSQDLAAYAELQSAGRKNMKLFASAMEAAEKASLKPINTYGAASVKRGRAGWAAAPQLTPARLAQEWMSWTLPARCEPTARTLRERARLMGAGLQANTPDAPTDQPPAEAAAPETPKDADAVSELLGGATAN